MTACVRCGLAADGGELAPDGWICWRCAQGSVDAPVDPYAAKVRKRGVGNLALVLLIGVPILCALYVVFRLLSWGHPAG